MKLSARTRYGLMALIELAILSTGEPVMMKKIAENRDLPKKYLDQIFVALRISGLIKTMRGASGGYLLSKPASVMRVDEIIRALEGDINFIDCPTDNQGNPCGALDECAVKDVGDLLTDVINQALSKLTLEDLVNRQQGVTPECVLIPKGTRRK